MGQFWHAGVPLNALAITDVVPLTTALSRGNAYKRHLMQRLIVRDDRVVIGGSSQNLPTNLRYVYKCVGPGAHVCPCDAECAHATKNH